MPSANCAPGSAIRATKLSTCSPRPATTTRPCAAEIACDLWEFQAALADATRATDDQARAALRRAVDAYRGDLLQGSDYPWVEPVRQDLHRRALDAHLRLAELEDHSGQPDAAADTLERAIDIDRYAEEPYRRLMALHGAHGRIDAVTATWKLLHQRLGDLDLEVEPATTRLYRSLTISDRRHVRRCSPDPSLVVTIGQVLPGIDKPRLILTTCALSAGIGAAMGWRFGWSAPLPAFLRSVGTAVDATDLV